MNLRRVSDYIGSTPMVQIDNRINAWKLLLKLEKFNPGQSMKDRMARNMVDDAERRGLLRPGGTIVESSSGNTATGLAIIAAERGYHFVAVVDCHAAKDKILTMRAYGAEIVTVGGADTGDGPSTAERDATALRLSQERPNTYWTRQHDNAANADAYFDTLAEEILQDTGGRVDVLVGGIGTGGSLCGTGRRLKRDIARVEVIGVEPEGSIIFGGEGKPYYQSGTGTPAGADLGDVIDYSVINRGVKVSDQQAFNTARFLAREHGILIGGSAGGVLYKAVRLLRERRGDGVMVVIIADGGEKYLDTVFNDDWMRSTGLLNQGIEREIADVIVADRHSDRFAYEALPLSA